MQVEHLTTEFKLSFSKRKGFYLIGTLLAILALFFLTRTCSTTVHKHHFRIGKDNRWFTLNLMGKEKNLTAFSDDLLWAIAKEEGFRITFFHSTPPELMTGLEQGTLDGILSPLLPDSSLERKFEFSDPYILLGPVLVVPIGSDFDTWQEAKYKIIGILPKTSSIFEMRQDVSIQFHLYENALKALSDLENRQIDGVVLDAIAAYTYVNTFYKNRLRIATTPLTNEGFRLLTMNSAQGKALVEQFNDGLKKLKESGKYDELIKNWGLINPENIQESSTPSTPNTEPLPNIESDQQVGIA